MSITLTQFEYLEKPYLGDPYLASLIEGSMGMQADIQIVDKGTPIGMQGNAQIVDFEKPLGMQGDVQIVDQESEVGMQADVQIVDFNKPVGMQADVEVVAFQKPLGMQGNAQIVDFLKPIGMQGDIQIVNSEKPIGMQVDVQIVDFLKSIGMQADVTIIDFQKPLGMEARKENTLVHLIHGTYLNQPYLQDPYLQSVICALMGMQADVQIVDFEKPLGMQADIQIVDFQKFTGMQADRQITDFEKPIGMQAQLVAAVFIGMQANIAIYNTTNLRILCEFPSRGLSIAAGGTGGLNWTASSTEAGDFSVNNLNTDIEEQIWRSATGVLTSINVTSDTELPQGIFLDTVAVRNHNLTSSASVTLLGSNDAGFASIGVTIPMQVTPLNMYYIASDIPISAFRYWRFVIDDASNPAGFVSIGTILFGAAQIFQGECFVDQIGFGKQDFADKIGTEGHTNVANSRALKRALELEFRSLRANRRNFRLLRDIFDEFRTTHKCLWIPTPSVSDQTVTDTYAVFSKLLTLPRERHNSKGPLLDFVSFSLDFDESQ